MAEQGVLLKEQFVSRAILRRNAIWLALLLVFGEKS
jgi:hypothetical protein